MAECLRYKISQIPKNYENDGPYIRISYNIKTTEDRIEIYESYIFKKNIYEARFYPALKATFNQIVSLSNEMIVLEKK